MIRYTEDTDDLRLSSSMLAKVQVLVASPSQLIAPRPTTLESSKRITVDLGEQEASRMALDDDDEENDNNEYSGKFSQQSNDDETQRQFETTTTTMGLNSEVRVSKS